MSHNRYSFGNSSGYQNSDPAMLTTTGPLMSVQRVQNVADNAHNTTTHFRRDTETLQTEYIQGPTQVLNTGFPSPMPTRGTVSIMIHPQVQIYLRNILMSMIAPADIPQEIWPYLGVLCDPSSSIFVEPRPSTASPIEYTHTMSTSQDTASHTVPFPGNVPLSPETTTEWSPNSFHTSLNNQEIRCRWGDCRVPIMSSSFGAIEAHLRTHHFGQERGIIWVPGDRGMCQWVGCTWQRPMLHRSFAKHIATQHLGTTATSCPDCGEEFTRGDSRNRHALLRHGGALGSPSLP
ncbi:uncharacterized protein FIBRA_08103 [Fibroporia radiculosa]|uniref:C2H2-type domain-containing protein n=1 Tax=Fibroporia radiculosa TaxID=599839 RepID=J4I257_9APHY|nr:uncharacterized protein FIBRA_08103 [Fibroporia radiculosa]CCM05867.1 predicted protein [Fibroporia radiculosa]